MLIIDFETRSHADLTSSGAFKYASHSSTDIICMAAKCLKTDEKWLWFTTDPVPDSLIRAIKNADCIAAHNAAFDREIYYCIAEPIYGFPPVPDERWYCTAAQCRVNALPSGLDKAVRAITGQKQKMAAGSALIKKLSIPRADRTFCKDPDLIRLMGEYCLQDVEVTAIIIGATRPMTEQEHLDWLINEEINIRGVKVDVGFCRLASAAANEEKKALSKRLTTETAGVITKTTQTQRIRNYVLERVNSNIKKMMEKTIKGETKTSFDRSVRSTILTSGVELPPKVKAITEIMQQASNTSTAKFGKMADYAEPDSRIRGSLVYAGASQTGRFSSKGVQVHNFKRDCLSPDQFDDLKSRLINGDEIPDTIETLSRSLRSAIIPDKGNVLVVGDWSAIEARVLPWLSGGPGTKELLNVFKRGEDVYMYAAKNMRLTDRFIGKVATLALGYQGGVNAFNAMAGAYGLRLTEAETKTIIRQWRNANPWAVDFWDALNVAAKHAMIYQKDTFSAGRVTFTYNPDLLQGTLLCRLPDESTIQYPHARLETVENEFGHDTRATYLKASLTPEQGASEWPRGALYGGLIAENITQATSATLLKSALRQLDNVVLHVHDEIVLEVPEIAAKAAMEDLRRVMETPPKWAKDLPLKAEPKIMLRYGK